MVFGLWLVHAQSYIRLASCPGDFCARFIGQQAQKLARTPTYLTPAHLKPQARTHAQAGSSGGRSSAGGAVSQKPGQMWVDKYKPTSSSGVIGHGGQVKKLKVWLQSWESWHLKRTGAKPPTVRRRDGGTEGARECGTVFGPIQGTSQACCPAQPARCMLFTCQRSAGVCCVACVYNGRVVVGGVRPWRRGVTCVRAVEAEALPCGTLCCCTSVRLFGVLLWVGLRSMCDLGLCVWHM